MPVNLIIRNPLDRDAREYFSRANISSSTARTQINGFVRGLKALGVWPTTVCWALRSSQNAGTGTTAYSFGGLGSFDGTLVSGPTWGANGISCTATNQNVTIPDNVSLYTAKSGLAAFRSTSTGFNQQLIEVQDGVSSTGWYYLFRFQGVSGSGAAGLRMAATRAGLPSGSDNTSRTIDLVNFQTGSFAQDDTSDDLLRNGSLEVGGSRTGLAALNATGPRALRVLFGNSTAMTGAFAMVSQTRWSNAQALTLHNLYRDTLGAGLGLP